MNVMIIEFVCEKNKILVKFGLYMIEIVLLVKYYMDCFFYFWIMCLVVFCFWFGEFIMIGLLKEDGKFLLCVYLVVSLFWDEVFDFYLIKVFDGLLIFCF